MGLRTSFGSWKSRLAAGFRALGGRLESRPRITLAAVALLAVAAVAVATVVWVSGDDENDADRIQEAREAAETSAVRLFSYGAATLEQDLENAKAVLVPEAAATFEEDIAVPTREEIAANPGLENRIIVAASGVTSDPSDEDVNVLVLFNRIIRLPDNPQAQTIRLSAQLRMHEQGDRWLVAEATQF